MVNDNQNQNTEVKEGEVQADGKKPNMIKCPKCGDEMPDTIVCCVVCGAPLKKKKYEPISEKKARTIRWIVGGILIVLFVMWYVLFF